MIDLKTRTRVNAFGQVAPDGYIRQSLVFDVPNENRGIVEENLRNAVRRLGDRIPLLRTSLKVDDGVVVFIEGLSDGIESSSDREIELQVRPIPDFFTKQSNEQSKEVFEKQSKGQSKVQSKVGSEEQSEEQSQKQLFYEKNKGFPAKWFIDEDFEVKRFSGPFKSLIIRADFIDGGLILGLHLHHFLGDGYETIRIATWLSEATCGGSSDTNISSLEFPFDGNSHAEGNMDIKAFKERTLSNGAESVSLDQDMDGKIFVFDIATNSKFQAFRKKIGNDTETSTTTNSAVWAFSWAHVAKARLAASNEIKTNGEAKVEMSDIYTTMDFRKGFKDEFNDYFGNANEMPRGKIETDRLLKACKREDSWEKNFGPLTTCIRETLDQVDEDYISKRTKLYTALTEAGDSKKLKSAIESTNKYAIQFNSKRRFCKKQEFNGRWFSSKEDQQWNLTGERKQTPVCVRRTGDNWGPSSIRVMPECIEDKLEVLITIEKEAMELLLEDEAFMAMVTCVEG